MVTCLAVLPHLQPSAPGAAAARAAGGRRGVGFLLLLDVEMAVKVLHPKTLLSHPLPTV